MIEYQFERSGMTATFTLGGRLDAQGSLALSDILKDRLLPDDTFVILETGGVTYISSAGIRVLAALEKSLRQRNGCLYICGVQPAVAKVLEITGFNRFFTLCPTRQDALFRSRITGRPAEIGDATDGTEMAHTRLSVASLPDHNVVLRVTGKPGCRDMAAPEDLSCRIFEPGEYSLGIGGPGESPAAGFPDPGPLLSMGGAIFWKPPAGSDAPDYLIPRDDAPRVLLNTAFSLAVDAQFHEIVVAEPIRPEGARLADLISDILVHAKNRRGSCPPVISTVLYAGLRDPDVRQESSSREDGSRLPGHCGDRTLVAFGLFIDTTADLSGYDRDTIDAILCRKPPGSSEKGPFLYQYGLLFDSPPSFASRDITRLVAETVAEKVCTDLVRLPAGTLLSRAVLGISYITEFVFPDRVPVSITGTCPGWNSTYETITRWLNPGCRDLELIPLTGGFSGTLVFRVRARDRSGRTMMPLVMKLGPWPLIEAEIRGYTGHVKRYIQNNATQIIETERLGDFGGILYNFVGIRGPESRITSLEDFYHSHGPDAILPVFDALFNVVLDGWYREPQRKDIALYREYRTFWNYDLIRSTAVSRFGADPDRETIRLPFGLGLSVNPLWFVENVLPERLPCLVPVFESSVHGDLNMKNVLMDETQNLWLIDFAETRSSHILRDIVKLEAVIKGEMVPPGSREDLAELVALDVRFLSARALSDIPDLPDKIRDPALEKAFRTVRNLRQHANRITPGDDDITQYWIALLPYTLNLLSYTSVNDLQREYGWIASSLICRNLMGHGDGCGDV